MSMHFVRGARGLLVGAVTAALLLGGALGASADPIDPGTGQPAFDRPLDGVGSGETQELYNGLSNVVTDGGSQLLIASWDAGPGLIQTRPGGPFFARPQSGSEGVMALRAAKTGGQWKGVTLSPADLAFARVTAPATFVSGGSLSYVPLAVDAVTYASASAGVPDGLSRADLTAIYSASNGQDVTLSNGQTYAIGLENNASADIVPLLPQVGTGGRSFFMSQLGLTEPTLGSAVAWTYSGGAVQENDGSAIATVDGSIMPFSIAQHIAQGNAATLSNLYGVDVLDRRHGAVLHSVTSGGSAVPPTNPDGTLNMAFPIARPVFTVIWHGDVAAYPYLAYTFVGDEGAVYHATSFADTFTIEDFGYGSFINRETGVNGLVINGVLYRAGDAETFRAN